MRKMFLYDLPILPNGFKFPAEYLDLILSDVVDIAPWKFMAEDMALSLFYYGSMLLKFPAVPLIPFAIIQDESGFYNDGWVVLACFDGGKEEGVIRVYDYSKPKSSPWDNASYSNFSEWLDAAKMESAHYKAERAES